jgi:hypothetical protein
MHGHAYDEIDEDIETSSELLDDEGVRMWMQEHVSCVVGFAHRAQDKRQVEIEEELQLRTLNVQMLRLTYGR